MDPSSLLDKYTQDLSNLPQEVKHLLEEVKNKDYQLQEARKRYQSKDNQIFKYIRANGTLNKHPKEQQLYAKIEDDMDVVWKLQKEKILLSNTALFLVSKHLLNFEVDIAALEKDDLLPPLDNLLELDGDQDERHGYSDSTSGTATPLHSGTPSGDVSGLGFKRSARKKMMKGQNGVRGFKRRSEDYEGRKYDETSRSGDGPGEDADNNLYCFCQRVSFGEMIGCDNDDCKYEWFHWGCVGITSPPKDDEVWYCPDCAPKMEKRNKKRRIMT